MNTEEFLSKLGTNIKRLREKRGLSTAELAELTGIKKSYLEKMERGKAKRIKCYYINFLVKALKTNPTEIFDGI